MTKQRYYISKTSSRLYIVSMDESGKLSMFKLNGEQLPPTQVEAMTFSTPGGVSEFFDKLCFEDDRDPATIAEEKRIEREKLAADRRAALAKQREKEEEEIRRQYQSLLDQFSGMKIPATEENIYIVARYLQRQNWGSWTLPELTVGYTASQYDCDGKIAVGFVFDEPIPVHRRRSTLGDAVCRLAYGAPNGHLEKYYKL